MVTCKNLAPRDEIFKKSLSEFADIDESKIDLLMRIDKFRDALERAKQKHLQHWNMSEGRLMVIMAIWCSGDGTIKASDIAQELGVTRATMTGLIDSLMRDEFIAKKDCPEDRRVAYLSLSAKGQDFLKMMMPEHTRAMKAFTDVLSDDETKEFVRILAKLQDSLSNFIELECETATRK